MHAVHQEFFLDPDFECALDVMYCDVSNSVNARRSGMFQFLGLLSAGSDVRRRQPIRPLEIF